MKDPALRRGPVGAGLRRGGSRTIHSAGTGPARDGFVQLDPFPNPGRGCHLGLQRWPAELTGADNIRTVTLSVETRAASPHDSTRGDGRRMRVQMSPGAADRRSDGCVGGLAWLP